ncbi:hypothetical protein [Nocardioides sp. NPDC006273]|uniref:hypothetical protein n=1 Tax=Nocardioides sp. NPDC006273 TaxID=3155598 RepID=UPI0033B3FA00
MGVKESDLKPVADRIAEWEDDGGLATRLNGWDLTSNGVVVGSDVAQKQLPNGAVAAFVELAGLELDQYTSEEIKPFGAGGIDDSFRVSLDGVEDPMGVTITVLKELGGPCDSLRHALGRGTRWISRPGSDGQARREPDRQCRDGPRKPAGLECL